MLHLSALSYLWQSPSRRVKFSTAFLLRGGAAERDLEIAATSFNSQQCSHTEGVVATSVALLPTTAR
ncbi:MAG: hypothetical protein J7M17_07435 [Anaerolineae bacterium]|nr:hypothetical protein [Anaerolineae bacterium]